MSLSAGQNEVKVEFPLPIVACNLMIEYADFYDNFQASAETLQCPRCSASVPANPGVCGNCGENVFQCHKCRYDIFQFVTTFFSQDVDLITLNIHAPAEREHNKLVD